MTNRRWGILLCLLTAYPSNAHPQGLRAQAGTRMVGLPARLRAATGATAGAPSVVRAAPARAGRLQQQGTLVGWVRAAPDMQPIAGARIQVLARLGEARTDARGRFSLELPEGSYALVIRALGFAPRRLPEVHVGHGDTTTVAVVLDPAPVKLEEIVVTPGTYELLGGASVVSSQTLSREYAHAMPHVGDDVYRVVDRLPGVTTHDITAKLTVRGAPNDQVLVQLDGLELIEPFHLKDWDGSLSIIDAEAVGDIELVTGGFTAEYGNKMAGVFAMHTTTPPPDRIRTSLGFSIMNLTGKSEGSFSGGRGTWLAVARYGFLGPTLKVLGEANGADPRYYDAFGKVRYQLGSRHVISGHLLHAGDDFAVVEEDGTDVRSQWGSSYVWMDWAADFTPTLSARTVVSGGRVTRDRRGLDYDRGPTAPPRMRVVDHGALVFLGLQQDWILAASDHVLLKWGVSLRHGLADYDYYRWQADLVPNTTDSASPPWAIHADSLLLAAHPSGQEIGLYQSLRLRLTDRLTAEVGARHDRQTLGGYHTVSPRANVAFDVAPRTTLRAAWGYYHQLQRPDELSVADGDDRFYPPQRAEHRVLSLEHRLRDGTSFRVEGYERRVSSPRPEYRSLVPIIEALWEESGSDRVRVAPTRSLARGIEFQARRDVGGRFAWSASYAFARADDEIQDMWVPRPRDQRHTVRLELAFRPRPSWSWSYAWQYHSGWPATREVFGVATAVDGSRFLTQTWGPMNEERLPAYHRLDIRVSKQFTIGNGRLEVYVDVFNAYNRRNAEAFSYDAFITSDGRAVTERGINPLLSVLPSLGVRWEF